MESMAFLLAKHACDACLLACISSESLSAKVLISLIPRLFSFCWL